MLFCCWPELEFLELSLERQGVELTEEPAPLEGPLECTPSNRGPPAAVGGR